MYKIDKFTDYNGDKREVLEISDAESSGIGTYLKLEKDIDFAYLTITETDFSLPDGFEQLGINIHYRDIDVLVEKLQKIKSEIIEEFGLDNLDAEEI